MGSTLGIDGSPLKWVGGKGWLVPRLKGLYAPHRTRVFVDLFVGGGSVPFGLLPRKAILNDINPYLINFYHWLRLGLKLTYVNPECNKERFLQYRARLNELYYQGKLRTKESAELFYWLNRYSFGGRMFLNADGTIRTSFGNCVRVGKVKQDLSAYALYMRNWTIYHGDFRQVPIPDGAFVYADPPYYNVETDEYTPTGTAWQDQVDLVKLLANHNGPVVASNQATKEVLQLYGDHGFKVQVLTIPRRLSMGSRNSKAYIPEMLATKNL